jgi:hypothetical protein
MHIFSGKNGTIFLSKPVRVKQGKITMLNLTDHYFLKNEDNLMLTKRKSSFFVYNAIEAPHSTCAGARHLY